MRFTIPIVLSLCVIGTALAKAGGRYSNDMPVVEEFAVAGNMAVIFGSLGEDLTAPPFANNAGQIRYTAIDLSNMQVLNYGLLGKGVIRGVTRSGDSLVFCLFDYAKPPTGQASFYCVDAKGCTKLGALEADCLGSFVRGNTLYAYSRNSVWELGNDRVWSKVRVEAPQADYRWVSMDASGHGYLLTDGELRVWGNGFSGKAITSTFEGKLSNAALGGKLWVCAMVGENTAVYEWETDSTSLNEIAQLQALHIVQADAGEKGAVFVALRTENGGSGREVFAVRYVPGKGALSVVNKIGKVRFARVGGNFLYLCDEQGGITEQQMISK